MKYYRHKLALLLLMPVMVGCASSDLEVQPPIVDVKKKIPVVENYHDTIAQLTSIYNDSNGLIPKSEIFYSVINDIKNDYSKCVFHGNNFQLKNVDIIQSIAPDMIDGKGWNIERSWEERWQFNICDDEIIKSITLMIVPHTPAQWLIK